MSKTEWKPCPICGAPDMRHEPETSLDDEEVYIVTCTNLSCASNGGTNAHALLKRILPKQVKHEGLFDLALETHDEAVALGEKYDAELDTMEGMTEAHEQQALTVRSAIEGVRRTTLKLMGMTHEDSECSP